MKHLDTNDLTDADDRRKFPKAVEKEVPGLDAGFAAEGLLALAENPPQLAGPAAAAE